MPRDAAVPEATRAELRRLHRRYALVACVSGRAGDDARRIVGLDELIYVGEHGLELEPEALAWSERLQAFADGVDWDDVERKPLTVTFHYRRAEDEEAARALLEAVADPRAGGGARRAVRPQGARAPAAGRRPQGHRRRAPARRARLGAALYAGDDTTDLDAFAALEGLELGVRVAVASAEGPPELREAADLVVDGPAEVLQLLALL